MGTFTVERATDTDLACAHSRTVDTGQSDFLPVTFPSSDIRDFVKLGCS